MEPAAMKALVRQRAEAAYYEKEVEYPVMAGLSHFTTRDPAGHKRYDREGLVAWVRQRFEVDLDLEDLKNKQRDEIRTCWSNKAGSTARSAASSRRRRTRGWRRPTAASRPRPMRCATPSTRGGSSRSPRGPPSN